MAPEGMYSTCAAPSDYYGRGNRYSTAVDSISGPFSSKAVRNNGLRSQHSKHIYGCFCRDGDAVSDVQGVVRAQYGMKKN
ncbi:hypothetical protein GX48_04525 [Paracoccidioides brasiliensis]|nr:hypothetical protein GX48_04525 [Paracoccidioides brasiliensis]